MSTHKLNIFLDIDRSCDQNKNLGCEMCLEMCFEMFAKMASFGCWKFLRCIL